MYQNRYLRPLVIVLSITGLLAVALVAAGFAPWQVRPHRVRPHIDSTSDQVLQIYRSLTKKKRQHCAHDETKPQKTCLFIVL